MEATAEANDMEKERAGESRNISMEERVKGCRRLGRSGRSEYGRAINATMNATAAGSLRDGKLGRQFAGMASIWAARSKTNYIARQEIHPDIDIQ